MQLAWTLLTHACCPPVFVQMHRNGDAVKKRGAEPRRGGGKAAAPHRAWAGGGSDKEEDGHGMAAGHPSYLYRYRHLPLPTS